MGKEFKTLKKLSSDLPVEVITRWGKDKDGDELLEVNGFDGNISLSPKYVTDGHVLLVAKAIPAHLKADIKPHEDRPNKASESQQKALLDELQERKTVKAEFVGVAMIPAHAAEPDDDYRDNIAVIRDIHDRLVFFNAHLFAFALKYTQPDSLAVDTGKDYANRPMPFFKDGKIVSVLMPMRLNASDLFGYDLFSPAVDVFGRAHAVS